MALMPFIFGGNTGIKTPQEAARLRAIADALAAHPRAPHTIGEGLSAIGDAIAQRRTSTRADRIESEGRAAYQSKYGDLVSGLISGGRGAVPPVPSAEPVTPIDAAPDVQPQPDTAQAYLPDDGMSAQQAVAQEATGQPDIQTAGISITADPSMQQPPPAQQPPQQPGVQVAGAGFDPRMIDALNDPWAPEGTKAVLGALLERRMKQMEPEEYGTMEVGGDIYRTSKRGTVEKILDLPDPPEKPTPDMQNFQFDQANGYQGTFHQWMEEKKPKEKPPGDVQTYEYAIAHGFKGTFEEWQKLKDPMVQVNTGDADPGDAVLTKKMAEDEAKRWGELLTAGEVAGARKQDLLILDEVIKTAPQGPVIGKAAEWFPGFTNAGALFNSVTKRIAPTLRTPGSGSTSDIEYEGLLQGLPKLTNYPEANAAINEMMKAKADINVERADIIFARQNEEITTKEARTKLRELNKRSIMSPKLRSILNKINAESDPDSLSDEELLKRAGGG